MVSVRAGAATAQVKTRQSASPARKLCVKTRPAKIRDRLRFVALGKRGNTLFLGMIARVGIYLRGGCAKAYLWRVTFRGRTHFKEFARLEVEHAGDNVGREHLDFRIQVAYHRVVIPARILDRVLE